jgi:hypothetical protein
LGASTSSFEPEIVFCYHSPMFSCGDVSIVGGATSELEKPPKNPENLQLHGPQLAPSHTGHRYPWPK